MFANEAMDSYVLSVRPHIAIATPAAGIRPRKAFVTFICEHYLAKVSRPLSVHRLATTKRIAVASQAQTVSVTQAFAADRMTAPINPAKHLRQR